MTVHQQDSSQPQQSQLSPQDTGLGLMMVVIEEAALAGILMVKVRVVLQDHQHLLFGQLVKSGLTSGLW